MSGLIPENFPSSLKVVTYGTERMDEFTLVELAATLPTVDFRQTFGMSELGILRVKSKSRTSLFMKVGGEGVAWRVENGVLKIKSSTRMMGYLNAESPFDESGWYDTKDLVEIKDDYLKVVGRITDVVNVAGLKFLTSEVEAVVASYPGVSEFKIHVKSNPITGQHIELTIQVTGSVIFDEMKFKDFLNSKLPKHMVPRRIQFGNIPVNHRFKKEG
jgi:acyl-coenzyme A synthetase/AMP-(fatty) acid ligase